MTDADRAAMRVWLDDAFKICLWPAQLQEDEPKFRAVYRMLCELVESGQREGANENQA